MYLALLIAAHNYSKTIFSDLTLIKGKPAVV